jgi:hypothetical protein
MKVKIQTNLPISDLALSNLEKFFERYFNLYPEKMKGA